MPKIAERQNVFIRHTLNGADWQETINVDFIPDEVIVKSVLCTLGALEVGVIFTNLVQEGVICSYGDGMPNNPHTSFPLKRQVRGQYTFSPRTVADAISASAGPIVIVLEFIKFA